MNTLFDAAGLAIVAYTDVASDGSSANINSGVTTTKTATGTYNVILPVGLAQNTNSDLIFVQPLGSGQKTATADNADPTTKVVTVYSGGSLTDGEFNILILRTVLSIPLVAP